MENLAPSVVETNTRAFTCEGYSKASCWRIMPPIETLNHTGFSIFSRLCKRDQVLHELRDADPLEVFSD